MTPEEHCADGRWRRRVALATAVAAVVAGTSVAVVGLVATVDRAALATILDETRSHPAGLALAAAVFLGAFVVRAWLWTRVAPGLGLGQAFAAIMIGAGGNHVLPLRLGEPLRIVSVVRRTGMRIDDAASSTVVLRVGDVLALLAIGICLAPGVMWTRIGWWSAPTLVAVAALGAWALARLGRAVTVGRLHRPDSMVLAGTFAAWLLEAVLVWRIATWSGAGVGYVDAVVVTAVAVTAQLTAITPGGIGTYEAAATAALVTVGVEPGQAVAIAIAVHAAKTLLTVAPAAVALWWPGPPIWGRLRLPATTPARSFAATAAPEGTAGPATGDGDVDGDVVLFLPARNEAPRVADVLARVPGRVAGRRVRILVVDDGSLDETARIAADNGATVIRHDRNRGLGAAVHTGFTAAVESGAAAVAFCDADGEYDPAELERLVEPVLAGRADYVVGSRFDGTIERMRPHRRLGNRVLTRWVAWMARLSVTDGQSGFRALSREAARAAVSGHDYNYAQVLTLDLARQGFRYAEVPITYRFRSSGTSFVRLGTYLRRCLPAAWRVINRPLGHDRATGHDRTIDPIGVQSSTT